MVATSVERKIEIRGMFITDWTIKTLTLIFQSHKMCFFDQQVFACGDYKWGQFRQHCAKEYRTGETCGMKLVMQAQHVRTLCRICEKIEVKLSRLRKEEDKIRRWEKEGANHRKASIEKAEDEIDELNRAIDKLEKERQDRNRRL
ncbi:MAG: hypothetical protein M1818_001419 [Claussenomyces sp. TS43310]|nr:MAG: hypothetical protein M1818_001419 [Claussenomyces sp. TS43310]